MSLRPTNSRHDFSKKDISSRVPRCKELQFANGKALQFVHEDSRFRAYPALYSKKMERGCVVLDQPQGAANPWRLPTSHALRLVFDSAALRFRPAWRTRLIGTLPDYSCAAFLPGDEGREGAALPIPPVVYARLSPTHCSQGDRHEDMESPVSRL